MTIQQCEYILEVYRSGSISGAAAKLFMAQSNLSNAIRSLEQELGFPIFVRSSHGVTPTEKGLAVLSQAGHISEACEKIAAIGGHTSSQSVRISGTMYTPVCDAYVQLCTEYQNEPSINFSYIVDLSIEEAIDRVYLSILDMAVFLQGPRENDALLRTCTQKGLHISKIAQIPIVLRIGPNHPLYKKPEILLSDFDNYTFIDYNNHIYSEFSKLAEILKISLDRTVYCPDRSTKNELISHSSMYGVGCRLTEASNERYRFRNIPLGDLHYNLYCIEQNPEHTSPAARRYIEIVNEMLKNISDEPV